MLKVTEMGVAGTRRISAQKNKVAFKEAATMAAPKPSFPMMKMNPPTPTQDTYMPQNAATLQRRGKGVLDFIPDSYIDDAIGAALVVVAGALTRGKFKNLSNLTETLQKGLNDLNTQVATHTSKTEAAPDLTKVASEAVNAALISANDTIAKANEVASSAIHRAASVITEFASTLININGRDFRVARVPDVNLSPQAMANLEARLHAEPAKQILGLGKKGPSILPTKGNIGIVTSEYNSIAATGGLGAVPKEIAENLTRLFIQAKSSGQEMKAIAYIPLYLGQLDPSDYRTIIQRDGGFVYQSIKGGQASDVMKLKKIHTMEIPIYTATKKTTKRIDLYAGKTYAKLEDFEKSFDELPENVRTAVNLLTATDTPFNKLQSNQFVDYGDIRIFKDKNGKIKANGLIDAILFDDEKFMLNSGDAAKWKLYNQSINSKETERFTYFDKFVYKHFTDPKKPESLPIPDAVILNDWQTGGLSALLKTMSMVEGTYRDIDPLTAEKLYNMPQIAALHNAEYKGENWDMIEDLVNVLFVYNAEIILKNSYVNITAPTKAADATRLDPEHFHAMFYGHLSLGTTQKDPGFSLQKMFLTYPDYVTPVSEGYKKEVSTDPNYAAGKLQLYAARAKTGKYKDPEVIKEIARCNNIEIPEGIDITKPTLIGITNGCDKANNILNANAIENIGKGTIINLEKLRP